MDDGATPLIGLMSGSSLDGVDLAFCLFSRSGDRIDWRIQLAETLPFSDEWAARLANLPQSNARTLAATHAQFGQYLGQRVADFLQANQLPPCTVASHGHTIFHEPGPRGFTCQIGDGAAIAARSGCPVIHDFRAQDVALGGQGAPLAAMADSLLFPEYDFLLNLGGIANLSCRTPRGYVAFDLTGANQILNRLAAEAGHPYDDKGQMAKKGQPNAELLQAANHLDFFRSPYPKSLGNHLVTEQLYPIFSDRTIPLPDRLHTACRHIAQQIRAGVADCITQEQLGTGPFRMLITGGGAFNDFLIHCIREALSDPLNCRVELPEPTLIHFKEALLMALLGYLRFQGQANCLPSATGAKAAAVGGSLHLPPQPTTL